MNARGACLALVSVLAAVFLFGAAVQNRSWAATDPILSAAEIDYPPFSVVDVEGRAGGFSVELMQAALAAMGRAVTFRTGPWAEVRGWLEHGEIEALPLVGRTPEREAIFDFTFPYMSLFGAIVVRADTDGIQDLTDLRGKSVAVMAGDNAEEYLRREDRGIEIRTYPTFDEALRELSAGRHDAVVVQRLVALRLIQETGLKNLKVVNRPIENFRQDFCFAVAEGDRDTLALLNEGLALVTADGTYRHLHAKWFAALELPTHRRIVVGGDHNYPPFEYLDENGRPAGYNVELTRAIALAMGLDIEIRLGPWSKIVEGLEKGEIDAIQGMFYSPWRDLKFDFSPPYIVNHCVGVVRAGEGSPPSSVQELASRRIVVQRGDIMHDFVTRNGLGDRAVPVSTQEEALDELAAGKHDCALVSRLTALYWIEKQGWKNLVVAKRPLLSPGYGYAVPNGHKALLATLSEGLQVIEKKGEYQRIYDQWVGVFEPSRQNVKQILRAVAGGVGPLLAIVLALFVWTRTLRRQVARKTAELHESGNRYRLLAENTLDVIWTMNLDLVFTYVNPAVHALTGHRPEEWIGSRLPDHCDEANFARMGEVIIDEMEKGPKGTGVIFEAQMLKKNGESFWVEIHGKVIYDAAGQPMALQGVTRDVSERKLAEEALRASEEQFSSAFRTSPYAITITRVADGRLLDVNDAFSEIAGYTREEALESSSILLGLWKNEEDRKRVVLDLARGLRVTGREYPFLRKNGETLIGSFSAVMLTLGDERCVVSSIEDVTERRRLEADREKLQDQLTQSQKMESVGRLAGGVAHDFNNMLGVILGYAEMAKDKIGPDDALFEDLEEILKAARRSADITRQLLAFARRQTIAPRVMDLNETVEGMLRMLRRLIGEDIDLQWLPEGGLWPVKIDPTQVDQMLANLCVNARDAIGGVGKITIETDNVRFDQQYCRDHLGFVVGEFVLLAVSDDGSGMDAETRDHLFEPFFTTKGVGQGTGLGLATVYGIVKQNDGFINVYSEPGAGTTFRIYLPRHTETIETLPAVLQPKTDAGRGETVLVVEDEASVLKLTCTILEGLGYTALVAIGPAEAERLAREHAGRIDLLITDVVMPQMNGRELAVRLKAVCPGLKILFMSGYTANVIAHHGVLEAGVHFIQKPFSLQELAARVREALG